MTQPPEDRRPEQPEGEGGPENEPTVAWTPPEATPEPPAEEGGVGYAAIPEEGAPAPAEPAPVPPAPNMPSEPPAAPPPPPPAEPAAPPPAEAPAQPSGPIISASPTPTPPASGWQTPDQPAAPPPPVPAAGSGWEVPAAPAAGAPAQAGYVIAGIGARFVAWLIDVTLAGLVPFVLTVVLFDWSGLFREMFEQLERDPTGRSFGTTMTIPVTLDYILVTLIGLGIQFLYFVGFWTSRWQATPGMIGLKMRVVDATTGEPISILQASKRWIALGWPVSILTLVPALQSSQGLILFAIWIFVFFTTVTNARRQGIHDRWANSLVIRSVTSGDGATFAGCLVWGVLVILIAVIFGSIMIAAMGPFLQEYIDTFPTPSP
jgi:uncharacterized RDD family membrane protein YckC